jgi:hypothetical protein|tara:strand:- start:544 stop:834 length:291 start_codon:yes stop_codon:yes gene_type:complete
MFTHRIIEATINDSADYDWMYDSALHNTLKEHFEWAKKSSIDLSFEKSYDGESGYNLMLCVDAKFTAPEDLALYKISFGFAPLKTFSMDNNEPEFI